MNKCCSSPSTPATSRWSPPQHVATFDVEVGHDEIRVMRTDSWQAWRHQVVLRCYVCGTGDATLLAKVPGNKTMNTSATAAVNPLAFTDDAWKKVKAPLYYSTSFNETATPSVSTVTPSSLNGAAGEDGIITLGGLGLRDLATVTIDGMECVVTAVDKEDNTTDLGTVRTCAFKRIDHTGSGRFPLQLVTKGGGEGISRLCPEGECAGPQLDLWPSVTSLSPSVGSLKGGQVITVRGAGFPAQTSRVTVLLGGQKCTVLSTSSEAITCVTPPSVVESLAVGVNASTVDVSVTVGKGPAAHLSRKKNTRAITVKGTRNNIALGTLDDGYITDMTPALYLQQDHCQYAADADWRRKSNPVACHSMSFDPDLARALLRRQGCTHSCVFDFDPDEAARDVAMEYGLTRAEVEMPPPRVALPLNAQNAATAEEGWGVDHGALGKFPGQCGASWKAGAGAVGAVGEGDVDVDCPEVGTNHYYTRFNGPVAKQHLYLGPVAEVGGKGTESIPGVGLKGSSFTVSVWVSREDNVIKGPVLGTHGDTAENNAEGMGGEGTTSVVPALYLGLQAGVSSWASSRRFYPVMGFYGEDGGDLCRPLEENNGDRFSTDTAWYSYWTHITYLYDFEDQAMEIYVNGKDKGRGWG